MSELRKGLSRKSTSGDGLPSDLEKRQDTDIG